MTASHPNAAKGILCVWNEYPEDDAAFYERWYTTEHIQDRLDVPGFLRARRYRAIEADRTYFSFYELANSDVLFTPAYLALLNAPTAWTGRIMRRWSGTYRCVCQRLGRNGTALGGYAAVARFEAPAALSRAQTGEIRERLADGSVVAVDVWQATIEQTGQTTESAQRGEADRTIHGTIIVEASTEKAARRAKAQLPEILGADCVPATIGVYSLMSLHDATAT